MCVQSQSVHGSQFYQAYDAQSDVASSVNGQGGGMNMPGGYAPGYGQFNQGFVPPGFNPGFGVNPFGASPEGWPGPGHNVQAQVPFFSASFSRTVHCDSCSRPVLCFLCISQVTALRARFRTVHSVSLFLRGLCTWPRYVTYYVTLRR